MVVPELRLATRRKPHHAYYHLTLTVFLLILTIYPNLFNGNNVSCLVEAFSAEDVDLKHNSISNFDIIQTGDIFWSKSIYTRDTKETSPHETNSHQNQDKLEQNIQLNAIPTKKHLPVKELHFSSLGRRFDLILSKPTHLVTDDFTVVSLDCHGKQTIVPYKRDDIQVMDGFIHGEEGSSRATASFNKNDKLMTAQIRTGQDTIIVEPTYLHKENLQYNHSINSTLDDLNNKLYNDTMIVYNLRDHKQFQYDLNNTSSNYFDTDKLCGSVKVKDFPIYNSTATKANSENQNLDDIYKYYKNSKFNSKREKRSIEYLVDQTPRDKTRCTLHLVADYLFYKNIGNGDLQTTINYLLALVNRVNQIYLPTVWETGDDKIESITNIGFTVQNITIHQEYTRLSTGDIHYNMQSSKVWGAREFLDNFSRHSPPRHYCLAHLLTYRQFDSPVLGLAYVASTRFGTIGGICSPTQQKGDSFYKHNTGISTSKGISGETLITRQADLVVAHELGHNLGAEHDSNDCRPSPSKGGAYLMHPFAVMGFEKNNRFLSNCSRLSIGRVIRRKASTCFVAVVDHVCGNGIVEDDEECDGGGFGFGHYDPCCDSSCRLAPGAQCSDRHSWCCSKCHIQPAGISCKPAEEFKCKQASYCDGRSPECPATAPPVEDDKICVGRGLCKAGECVSFCEAKGLISCLCNTPADACKLCCKSSANGTCVPYDNKAPYLQDGLLCYRGICEKGRCEQPIQDAVERLWDVLEDINFTTFVKFLRDNIIFVVLVISIPIWCIFSSLINEFDRRIKEDVMNAIVRHNRRRKNPSHSPFLPRLFVGDEISNSNSVEESLQNLKQPLKPPHVMPHSLNQNGEFESAAPGFRPPNYGFQLPEGEEVVLEPRGSIPLDNIEARGDVRYKS